MQEKMNPSICAAAMVLVKRMAISFLFLLCLPAQAIPADDPASGRATGATVLTLDDVIQLALVANRNVIGASYGVASRHWSLTSARSEFEWKWRPLAAAGADDYSRNVAAGLAVEKRFATGPHIAVRPRLVRELSGERQGSFNEELSAELTVPLLRGLGSMVNLREVRAAEHALRAAGRFEHVTHVNTVLEAVAGAYEIIQQRELLALFSAQAQRFESHAVIAATREKIGLATPIDAYRAEIRLKDAQSGLSRAQEALNNAADRLKVVLATSLEQVLTVTAPLELQELDISLDRAVDTALLNRVELKQARDDVAEAQRQSDVDRHNLTPRLDLVGQYARAQYHDRFNAALERRVDYWSVNLVGSTDWSRTAEKATYQQSLLAVRQSRLNLENRIDIITREVRQAYAALLNSRQQTRIREEQIRQAGGKLELAKIKFSHGMADNFDLIESETELQQARINLLAAKIDYIVGVFRLRAAIGTLIGA
jgi:outer membrane protein